MRTGPRARYRRVSGPALVVTSAIKSVLNVKQSVATIVQGSHSRVTNSFGGAETYGASTPWKLALLS